MIYYLRQDDVSEAYSLIKVLVAFESSQICQISISESKCLLALFRTKDLEPTVPQEYILKGVVNAAVGQVRGYDDDHDDEDEDIDHDEDEDIDHDADDDVENTDDEDVLARWEDMMMMMIKVAQFMVFFASDHKYH